MLALILAAGPTPRFARTADTPKPCLKVGGRPLLAYAVEFARLAGAAPIIVVTGHLREQTEPLARSLGVDDVLYNARHADAGNLQSLNTARHAGRVSASEGDFLLMNADCIYHPDLAPRVAAAAKGATLVTAFIDKDRSLGDNDLKVRLDGMRIVAIGKQLDAWDAGYVGLTFVPAARAADYFYTADNVHRERGDKISVEAVLQRMVGVDPADAVDLSGPGWLEVDDEADFGRAEAALARAPWYPPPRP